MRVFHLLTGGYAGEFRLNEMTKGRMDEVARFIHNALFLSHTIRRDVIVKVTLFNGPLAPITISIRGDFVRGLHPDERSIGGFLREVMRRFRERERQLPGTEVMEGYELPEGTVLDEGGERRMPRTSYFYVGGPEGFPVEPPGERVSLGGKVYTASQTVAIVNYLLDVGVWRIE